MTPTETAPSHAAPDARSDRINLRAWFVGFLLWMIALEEIARFGMRSADAGSSFGWAAWLLSLYAFYLSLCCTLFPAPTTWIVLLLASDSVAAQVGALHFPLARLLIVATLGAFATGIANLNEYHVFTFFLRYGRVAKVRDTRLYRAAARWFSTSPFLVIAAFSLIPIPVDVVRWLAITSRYPRGRYFLAYFVGRWLRYAGWAVASMGLRLTVTHIILLQAALVVLVAGKMGLGLARQLRGRSPDGGVAAAGSLSPATCAGGSGSSR